jgi:ribulose-phosphate 3-epimerase
VAYIRECGVAPGVVLNPSTPLTTLQEILPELDYVLLMSVNPGFGGQKFIPSVLRKTTILRNMIEASAPGVRIEIDGGVALSNISDLLAAGAEMFVAGSAVYDGKDPRQRARDLVGRLARGHRG